MVRNAVNNAFLNTITMGTAFPRVPPRNDPWVQLNRCSSHTTTDRHDIVATLSAIAHHPYKMATAIGNWNDVTVTACATTNTFKRYVPVCILGLVREFPRWAAEISGCRGSPYDRTSAVRRRWRIVRREISPWRRCRSCWWSVSFSPRPDPEAFRPRGRDLTQVTINLTVGIKR